MYFPWSKQKNIRNKDRFAGQSFYSSSWEQQPLFGFVAVFFINYIMYYHAVICEFFN